jgi:hypothetical protein
MHRHCKQTRNLVISQLGDNNSLPCPISARRLRHRILFRLVRHFGRFGRLCGDLVVLLVLVRHSGDLGRTRSGRPLDRSRQREQMSVLAEPIQKRLSVSHLQKEIMIIIYTYSTFRSSRFAPGISASTVYTPLCSWTSIAGFAWSNPAGQRGVDRSKLRSKKGSSKSRKALLISGKIEKDIELLLVLLFRFCGCSCWSIVRSYVLMNLNSREVRPFILCAVA